MDQPSTPHRETLNGLRLWLHDVSVAGLFLTRLPFRVKGDLRADDLSAAICWFPLIGLLVGGISAAALLAATTIHLPPLACAFIALATAALVTGALHEDGLADVVDGFGGGVSRDDKLRIMRDSHIGAYGVLALIFSVGLRASLLAALTDPMVAALTVVGAAVLSRSLLPGMMHLMAPARTDGLGAGAGRPTRIKAMMSLIFGALILWPLFGEWMGLAAFVAALVSVLFMAYIAQRQIGGYSGDVLGGAQQVAEISVLMTAGVFVL